MSQTVYLLGTLHSYQFGAGISFGGDFCSEEDEQAFQGAISDYCSRYTISAIAEEMSISALEEQSITVSVPKRVADSLSRPIPHLYCDPTPEDKKRLYILDENVIEYYGNKSGKSESEIKEEKLAERRKREPFWRDRIKDLNIWPVLFICGFWHVPSFSELLMKDGFQVEVLCDKWRI